MTTTLPSSVPSSTSLTTRTGLAGPKLVSDEAEWDERIGWTRVLIFHGGNAELDTLHSTYAVPGFRLSRRSIGSGLHEMRVVAAQALDGSAPTADNQVQVQWFLDGSDSEISIYKRMLQRGTVADPAALTPLHVVNRIEEMVGKIKSGAVSLDAGIAQVEGECAVSPTFDEDTAVKWLELVLGGVENHRVSNYVLRKVLVAPNAFVSTYTINIGKLYTKAQIQAEHTGIHLIPTGISAEMPSTGFYLKGTPDRATVGNGKIQITQEWQHAPSGTFLSAPYDTLQYDKVT